ncbi:MAG: hypothetical protein ACLQO1_25790 [Steroidobacteraceae bacterium]
MNAAREWMIDPQGSSGRKYLSDAGLQVPLPKQVSGSSLSTAAPLAWQHKVINRLAELTTLKENWDSYGARRPAASSAIALFNVLTAVMDIETPAPSVVPSPLGHFQAEWHRNGVDLEVEVITPTKIAVSFSDASDPTRDWDEELDVDFTRLVEAIARVGRKS